ncbi:hypothetical protein [Paraburkholderia acidisoli]|uniref:Uncharacterized protein n=1 Tax=Paraburkholderia acidisoli TaxID=2571748 RepID=A0A7Z2JIB6_9BURK|nr:hypothetical protein [Paraburkholderia acidisoli]QGZ66742.1 hypothetical protein FAZ98_33915 [Paraburkholderia acidisoli]
MSSSYCVVFGLKARWYGGSTALIVETIVVAGYLIALVSRECYVVDADTNSLRRERRIAGKRVSSHALEVPCSWWIQCRRTGSSAVLELCKGKAWDCLVLQEVFLGKGGMVSNSLRVEIDALRSRVATDLKIEDRGWEKYSL